MAEISGVYFFFFAKYCKMFYSFSCNENTYNLSTIGAAMDSAIYYCFWYWRSVLRGKKRYFKSAYLLKLESEMNYINELSYQESDVKKYC